MTTPTRIGRVLALLEDLDGIDVVSIDVFDTLLMRLTSPQRTLAAVNAAIAQRLGEVLPAAPDADAVAAHRDAFARCAAAPHGPGGDYTVRAWLAALARDLGLNPTITTTVGLAAELATECALTRADPDAIELFDALRRRGLRVVAASDTWLDTDVLTALLTHHGLNPDRVFSSGALGLSKRSGALFGHVASELGVAPHAILHVGDSWKADVTRPLQRGLYVAPWPRRDASAPPMLARQAPELSALLAGMLDSEAPADASALYLAGRSLLAPLLVAITIAHHAALRAARPDHIVYLARDAWPLFGVAERLTPWLPRPAPTTYLRLSRRAVSLAHPGDLLGTGRGLAGRFGKRTTGELLAAFDLSAELHHDLLEAAGLNDDSRLTTSARAALRDATRQLSDRLRRAAEAQRELLNDLLRQTTGGPIGTLALVDTGWAGTTQDAIAAALPSSTRLVGLYLGVSDGGLPSDARSSKSGLLWDVPGGRRPLSPLERTAGVIRMWELLLREPAPTVRSLRRLPDGRVDVDLLDLRDHPDVVASAELAAGVGAGITALGPVLGDVLRALPPSDAAWAQAARALACELTTRPARELTEALFALDYDEGAVQGQRTRVGTTGLPRGIGWLPGIAQQIGGRPAVAVLERAAELAERLRGR